MTQILIDKNGFSFLHIYIFILAVRNSHNAHNNQIEIAISLCSHSHTVDRVVLVS